MGGGNNKSPRPIQGFEQFAPLFTEILRQVSAQTGAGGGQGNTGTSFFNALSGIPFGQGISDAYGGLSSSADPSQFMTELSTLLRPSLVDYPFEQGAAALREQAALTGNLNSTGSFDDISQFRADLERNFAGVLPQTALGFGDLQRRSAVDLFNFLSTSGTLPAQLALQGAGTLGGAAANIPMYQPRSGGGFGNILGSILPLVGAAASTYFMGNPMLGYQLGTGVGDAITG